MTLACAHLDRFIFQRHTPYTPILEEAPRSSEALSAFLEKAAEDPMFSASS